jgi:hypothetical protein
MSVCRGKRNRKVLLHNSYLFDYIVVIHLRVVAIDLNYWEIEVIPMRFKALIYQRINENQFIFNFKH